MRKNAGKKVIAAVLTICMMTPFAGQPVTEVCAAEETVMAAETATGTDGAEETSEADFEWNGTAIIKYIGDGGVVVIPSRCTEIDCRAFSEQQNVTAIIISANVKKIEGGAVWCCENIETLTVSKANKWYNDGNGSNAIIETATNTLVLGCNNTVIPDGVKAIGLCAFMSCVSLKTINLPKSITSIGAQAFWGCSSLEKIDLLENITELGAAAFGGCESIRSVKIPEKVTKIGDGTFSGCTSLSQIQLPKALKEIGQNAFSGCQITELVIPEGVTEIPMHAFVYCDKLKKVTLPKSVQDIGYWAFGGCDSLEEITIPNGKISYSGLAGCNSLKKINLSEGVTSVNIDYCNALSEITLPESVTEAYFNNCTGLKRIFMPRKIQKMAFECEIYDDGKLVEQLDYPKELQLYVYKDTDAEKYAKEHGIPYVLRKEKPAEVKNLKAASAGKNKVKLTWTKSAGADGYIIYAKKNGAKASYIGMTSSTSFTDAKALDTSNNFYWVYAYVKDEKGKRLLADCKNYVYAKGVCTAVTNLKVASVKGGVKINWTKSAGAEGYLIYGKKGKGTYGYIGMTKSNTYMDKTASKQVYNFYWVFPYHKAANGKMIVGKISSSYVYGKAK